MRRRLEAFGAVTAILTVATSAHAVPTPLGAPTVPVPSSTGTGLDTLWATKVDQAAFATLDKALPLLDLGSALSVPSVGPVSFSNDLLPIGDFSSHRPMPYSIHGTPTADGQFIVARMTGAWAARAAGSYTLVVGSDDGYRLKVAGTTLIARPDRQSFMRAGTTVSVPQAGLYPIEIEYFNGIQEAALELSYVRGEVVLASPYVKVPAAFVVVPKEDLYPVAALTVVPVPDAGVPYVDAGVPYVDAGAPYVDAGVPYVDAGARDATAVDAASLDAGAPILDAAGTGPAPATDADAPPDDVSDAWSNGVVDDATAGPVAQALDASPAADTAAALTEDDLVTYRGGGCNASGAQRRASQAPAPEHAFAALLAGIVVAAARRGRRTRSR